MSFDNWCAAHGVYLNDSGDAATAAKLMARRAWDAAQAAEREHRHQWSEAEAIAAAHAAGFAGVRWAMGPEELAHLLSMARARPNVEVSR